MDVGARLRSRTRANRHPQLPPRAAPLPAFGTPSLSDADAARLHAHSLARRNRRVASSSSLRHTSHPRAPGFLPFPRSPYEYGRQRASTPVAPVRPPTATCARNLGTYLSTERNFRSIVAENADQKSLFGPSSAAFSSPLEVYRSFDDPRLPAQIPATTKTVFATITRVKIRIIA